MRLGWIFVALLCGVPSLVSAAALERAELVVEDDYLALEVDADVPIGDTAIRTEPGIVRVWFHGMGDDRWLDPVVDGRAISIIRVRPGFGDTVVVYFRLGDRRTVPASSIRIEADGHHAVIRIPRSELPPVGSRLRAPEPEVAEDPEPEAPAVETADETAAPAPPASSTPFSPDPASPEPVFAESSVASDTSAMWVLLLITILLAGAYVLVRFVFLKQRRDPLDDIEIVAQKRLGTRHQIVLVRALGEDHLLSVNGDATQRIASTPTAATSSPREQLDALLTESSEKTPSMSAAVERATGRPPRRAFQPDRSRQRAKESTEPFGPELFRLALENENKPPPTVRPPRGGRAQESEAVAGLLRMRDRLAAN